jgi:tRNA 2-thiouridine synthesizing protein B
LSTLHTFNKTLAAGEIQLRECLRTLVPGDALLLIEDGAYLATSLHADSDLHHRIPAGVALYVLEADLAARGISARIPARFSRVDYRGFVALCLAHGRVVNWN